jgi:diacylglycerol kinase (ATP)
VTPLAVGESHDQLTSALKDADALVLAGGDGTVHRTAQDAATAGVPVYHVPCGNENLFAREFGMTRDPELLISALADRRVVQADIAQADNLLTSRSQAGGAVFLLMCGIGIDASIIRRLTALRTRAIGHFAYVEPILREALSPCFPRLTVTVDGEQVIDHRSGMLIIANSRQYALRIDPAAEASMTDGLLDVVFLPCRTIAGAMRWLLISRTRASGRGAIRRRAKEITIRSDDDAPYQLDGDAPSWAGNREELPRFLEPRPLSLHITLSKLKLPVLLP